MFKGRVCENGSQCSIGVTSPLLNKVADGQSNNFSYTYFNTKFYVDIRIFLCVKVIISQKIVPSEYLRWFKPI